MLPEALQAARLRLVRERPYLASILWAMVPVERVGIGTLGVDAAWRLYYDQSVVNIWSINELAGVLYHETIHILREHADRCTSMNAIPGIWNVACDLAVNDDLIAENVSLPDKPLLPSQYGWPNGLLEEEYYKKLVDSHKPSPGEKKPSPGMGSCGSCAHGQQESWEDSISSGDSGSGGIATAEAELIRRKVAEDVTAAIKSQGNVPGHLARWAKAKLAPSVDWRKALAGTVRAALAHVSGTVDFSYSKPSRRQHGSKVVLPSMRRPAPEVAVVVDTSGSIGIDELAQALGEVKGILRAVGTRGATVLSVDTAVQTCRRVFDIKQVKFAGGGGTNMGVGIHAAMKLRPRPDVVVVLTDGLTDWPKQQPSARVVVGVLGEGSPGPAWAKTVKVEVSKRRAALGDV